MDDLKFQAGSLFWLTFISLSMMGLMYLGVWSFHNNNVKGLAISSIFAIMILFSVVISKFEIFKASGGWKVSCLSFLIGFSAWFTAGYFSQKASMSLLSVGKSGLFAQISSELPRFWSFVLDTIFIPTAEETLWLIGLPFALIWGMNIVGAKWAIFSNKAVQLIFIVLISGLSFAFFHVGKLLIAFMIAAFIFRGVMIVLLYGDAWFNIIPSLSIVPAFMVGAHIGNNWATEGLWSGIKILATSPVGWFILFLLLIIVVSALDLLFEKLFGLSVAGSGG